VPPGDSGALAEQILRLLADEELAHRMGQAGYSRVKRMFDLDRQAAAYSELYDLVLR
jgi:glycosyltransferase involved in cell wall biosynthesis